MLGDFVMKINKKSVLITTCIILFGLIIFYMNVALFISGPSVKYEDKLEKEQQAITKNYKDITLINRHVFQYVVLVGEDKDQFVWFNENSKAIDHRKKATYKERTVEDIVRTQYHAMDIEVTLGYGYKNPCYVVTCDQGLILLDYDSLKEIYYLKKGE